MRLFFHVLQAAELSACRFNSAYSLGSIEDSWFSIQIREAVQIALGKDVVEPVSRNLEDYLIMLRRAAAIQREDGHVKCKTETYRFPRVRYAISTTLSSMAEPSGAGSQMARRGFSQSRNNNIATAPSILPFSISRISMRGILSGLKLVGRQLRTSPGFTDNPTFQGLRRITSG